MIFQIIFHLKKMQRCHFLENKNNLKKKNENEGFVSVGHRQYQISTDEAKRRFLFFFK